MLRLYNQYLVQIHVTNQTPAKKSVMCPLMSLSVYVSHLIIIVGYSGGNKEK